MRENGSKLSSFVLQQSRLDSKMECLQLTMTEVLKRQNSKSKKGYNQVSETRQDPLRPHNPCSVFSVSKHAFLHTCSISEAVISNRNQQFGLMVHEVQHSFFSSFQQLNVTEVKVDKVQVSGAGNTTFAVCLDQDEKKILQSVTRSE